MPMSLQCNACHKMLNHFTTLMSHKLKAHCSEKAVQRAALSIFKTLFLLFPPIDGAAKIPSEYDFEPMHCNDCMDPTKITLYLNQNYQCYLANRFNNFRLTMKSFMLNTKKCFDPCNQATLKSIMSNPAIVRDFLKSQVLLYKSES